MKQKVGLVLSKVPGYSETFFRNKIAGLQSEGITVVLLITEKHNIKQKVFGCKVVTTLGFNGNRFYAFVSSVIVLLRALLLTPKRSLKHFGLDHASGISVIGCLKRLVQNAFLFEQELDWLHFGFGMLAVGRENVAEAIGAKMAVSFRGFDMYLSPLKHPNCYDLLFKKNVRYHVLSQSMKAQLILEGIKKTAIHVITPAIDVNQFKGLERSQNGNPLHILTVARLHWIKGLEYTFHALAKLKKKGILFSYTVIGSGKEYERLIFAAYQLGIYDDIIFTGELSQQAVIEIMEKTDIYIQYSIQEGFCNAVLEAQSMGLVCVVSDAEGLKENVLHEETGWVVPKRQSKLLAKKIQEVIALPNSIKTAISDKAVTRVCEQFNLKSQQQAFIKFYNLNGMN